MPCQVPPGCGDEELRHRADQATEMLCRLCAQLLSGRRHSLPADIRRWFEEHQHEDEERRQRENNHQQRRRKALAKLTREERLLLGLSG